MQQIQLILFLREINSSSPLKFNNHDNDLLIRQARHANLLSRIANILSTSNSLDDYADKHQLQLRNSIKISDANARSARWEILDTYRILKQEKISFIVLKGCAYIWLNNNSSKGRLFGDTDILIKKNELSRAEKILSHHRWVTTKLELYDQHFYREWMHEIPPLHHVDRHTSLDVHHSIIPPIIKNRFDIDRLWENAIEDEKYPGLYTLHPFDMILHSATHLFHEGEFENGLRDLVDLDALLREYIIPLGIWGKLFERADELDLSIYLYHTLILCEHILKTPVSDQILHEITHQNKVGSVYKALFRWLFTLALLPNHSSCKLTGSDFARWILLIRSHWIRMPVKILLPHLLKKSLSRKK